ncbi:MAG: hypothetical protein K1X67_01990 [Fimbriimonadaceae bacterium]|nr:hypothetical protein [Fimbriimonadaceae bacterium]
MKTRLISIAALTLSILAVASAQPRMRTSIVNDPAGRRGQTISIIIEVSREDGQPISGRCPICLMHRSSGFADSEYRRETINGGRTVRLTIPYTISTNAAHDNIRVRVLVPGHQTTAGEKRIAIG